MPNGNPWDRFFYPTLTLNDRFLYCLLYDMYVAKFYLQYLPFESVWHSLAPHVTFVMEPTDTGVKEVFCEINCYQIQRENIWTRIKIAEKISMVSQSLDLL